MEKDMKELHSFILSSPIMVAIDGAKSSRFALKWTLNTFFSEGEVKLKLIHIHPTITMVPTPMGNYIPICQVRDDVVSAYRKDVEWQIQAMILPYKEICKRRKVVAEIIIKEADDVAEAIAEEVGKFNISKLVIGASSRNIITRKLKGMKMSTKISECSPSFCTVFVIKNGKLCAVRSATDESSKNLGISNSSCCSSISGSDPMSAETLEKSLLPQNFFFEIQCDETLTINGLNSDDTSSPCSTLHNRRESSNSEDNYGALCFPAPKVHSGKSKIISYRNYQSNFKSCSSEFCPLSEELLECSYPENKDDFELEKQKSESRHDHGNFEIAEIASDDVSQQKRTLVKAPSINENQCNAYTWEEIESATSSFSQELKLGAGANGTVYKGTFTDTIAAVKILNSNEEYGTKQLKQELEILSKLHHPHLLTLLGACISRGCLVYEYMKNGSLDDCLHCKHNAPPLPWQHRFRIAREVASALVFLHHAKPVPIVHRDLKPANILLDENFLSKIGDVGLSTILPSTSFSMNTSWKDTAPVGTFFYIDPEYQRTGLVSPKSDAYAFGVVILQLLTAKFPMGLAHAVETAMEDSNLMEILDPKAGKWPEGQAHELARLGLSCSELRRKDRPDLKDHVLPVLDRLVRTINKDSYLAPKNPVAPPKHFKCQIAR
ncbi:U-box domain-containing protein 35 [Platanthera guangdongensis]|uniref:RING-type E3 ubiquitin transferase n=1 Tax=Platanthera guangdongensis TaxID=2320717 RepID=A0ABR2LQ60_9ASPA